jgi:hypothetical protein
MTIDDHVLMSLMSRLLLRGEVVVSRTETGGESHLASSAADVSSRRCGKVSESGSHRRGKVSNSSPSGVGSGARTLVAEPGVTTAGTADARSRGLRSECGFPGERGLIGKGVVLEAAEDNSGAVFLHLLGERRWHRRKQLTLAMQIQAFCL